MNVLIWPFHLIPLLQRPLTIKLAFHKDNDMKIGIISTYPPVACGIATYSSYLIEELRRLKNRVFIVCHMGGEGLDCYPAFNYSDPDLPHKVFYAMVKHTPNLIHIQHEFGLFGERKCLLASTLFEVSSKYYKDPLTNFKVLP